MGSSHKKGNVETARIYPNKAKPWLTQPKPSMWICSFRLRDRFASLDDIGDFTDLWYPRLMALDKTTVSYSFEELVIWRTRLPQAQHAVNPPCNELPNPLVAENMVYVSVFSP